MLLEALVACAGVTLKAVATALGIALARGPGARRRAISTFAARSGSTHAPVGFTRHPPHFDLDTDAPQEQIDTLLKLTERYCVVLQTLRRSPTTEATIARV